MMMENFVMNYLFILMITLVLLTFKYMLMILMVMELLILTISMIMYNMMSLLELEFFMIYYLIFSVCESVLGLMILILVIRHYGNEMYYSMNLFKF